MIKIIEHCKIEYNDSGGYYHVYTSVDNKEDKVLFNRIKKIDGVESVYISDSRYCMSVYVSKNHKTDDILKEVRKQIILYTHKKVIE